MATNLVLSKDSSESEIKAYFNAVLKLSQSNNEFPINLDEVWMLVYSEKGKAVRALKENFIEGVDYNTFAKNGKTEEAVKERTDKYLAERHEAMSKTAKATMHEGYNNKNIPVSAYYNVNSTGRFGSRYVGD